MRITGPRSFTLALLSLLSLAIWACDKSSPTEPSPPPCTFSLSKNSLSFGAGGGSDSITVNTASNCAWSATSDRGWMSITSGTSGTGSGVVQIAVTANSTESARTGTLTIAGVAVPVIEDGLPACSITLSPDRASFTKDAATGTFAVSTASHCQWSAVSNAAWIGVVSGSPGTGNGTVAYAIQINRDPNPRTGTTTIGGTVFTVVQAGDTPGCTYSLSATSLAFVAGGGSQSITVTALDHCSWEASSDSPWISVASAPGVTGNGAVTVTAAPNPGTATRTGMVTIAGQTVAVRQDGSAPCSVDLTPAGASYGNDAATGSFAVTAPGQCAWTASPSAAWVTITSDSSGTGSGTVGYSVAANTSTAARNATISVANRTFSISQLGNTGSCDYLVQPVDLSACMVAPSLSVSVTTQAGCTWTATPDAPWITVLSGQSGVGSGVINFRLSDNYVDPRQGILMVRWPTPTAGQNVRISQAGCRYAVSTFGINIGVGGGTGRFDVYQQSDPTECGGQLQDRCVWTAEADVPWITITSPMPRAGDNPVSFSVAPNATGTTRTGRITVRDKVVVVTQAGS